MYMNCPPSLNFHSCRTLVHKGNFWNRYLSCYCKECLDIWFIASALWLEQCFHFQALTELVEWIYYKHDIVWNMSFSLFTIVRKQIRTYLCEKRMHIFEITFLLKLKLFLFSVSDIWILFAERWEGRMCCTSLIISYSMVLLVSLMLPFKELFCITFTESTENHVNQNFKCMTTVFMICILYSPRLCPSDHFLARSLFSYKSFDHLLPSWFSVTVIQTKVEINTLMQS